MTDLTREYRSLGVLTTEQLQAAADRFDLGRVVAAENLGGLYGNNVGLECETGGWVLRGGIPPLEPDIEFRRERFFAGAIHNRSSVPAPWPYLIDPVPEIFGWPYALMPRLPGEMLHHQADLDWVMIGDVLASTAADLQSITWPFVGEWDPDVDDIAPVEGSPADWFAARVAAMQRRVAETSEALDPSSIAFVAEAVTAALPTIRDFQPTYVHGDFAISNVVIQRMGPQYSVTGVFDLGAGYAGDPEENLAIALWWPTFWGRPDAGAAFINAFRVRRALRGGQRERLRAYVILDMLENWQIGRRDRQPWYGPARSFREWAEPLVEQVDNFLATP